MGFRNLLVRCSVGISIAVWASLVVSVNAFALPFNQDMVGNQLVTGAIMRPKSPGSVPVGSLSRRIEPDVNPNTLVNPNPADPVSVATGKRLFEINCQVCHGRWENGKHIGNTLYAPGYEARNLADRAYFGSGGSYKEMSDGRIFVAIHLGKGLMPAYGWKLSLTEHWDLVNYVPHARAENP